ncbi:capsular exopolysaccharide family [Terrimicrobium sacchariphilum]|uniref:Capsular exopolysaccharide family n=1 Tax=Terrimicrobium sacchariphilum TaxID=690879 RepID=A0A146G2Q9_TERSA|nr:polysaccharide biosynthesis tyrosine autokinase [Terrimicrobium sacchariphilum]GAT31773.1 capsular exopolysaccharide family [Terrimicrobium sacchariphilum]
MSLESPDSGEIKLHFLDYWRVIRVRLPLIILVLLLVVITAGVVTYFMPKQYASTVTMQIRQNDKVLQVFGQGGVQGLDPRFLATQFEIIQRKEILYPVIDALGLDRKWGMPSREQAYFRLVRMINIQEIRNTELIHITVFSTDNKEAMEIANRIAEEYQKRRLSEENEFLGKSLAQLQQEVEKQQAIVTKLQETMTRIRQETGIQDLNPDTADGGTQAENSILLQVEQQVSQESLRVAALRAKYDQVSKMTDEQIMRSLTTLEIEDPTITQLYPQFQEAASEEARMLNAGLGANHPNVKALRAKKEVMQRQLAEQTAILRKTLETNLAIAEQGLKSLQDKLDKVRSDWQTSKTSSIGYYEAKNNWLQARKVLEAAQTRLATEKMEQTIPQSPTTIWESAEISLVPAKPNVVLNMVLGVIVGLVFGVGLAFFIEYLDTSVKTMEDVESFLKVPVLAVIPKGISLLVNEAKDNADAEAYRILRTNIEFNRKNPDANTITMISGGAGEGKSTTMSNLASIFASGGYSTLIVDADLRRPSQHRIFGVENEVGLTDFLTTDVHLEEVVNQTKIDNLFLMTSGRLPADAVGILNSQRMVDLIEEVKHRFDIVFFDSPPILGVSDASVLSSAVDLTIIVVQHRRFPRAMLQRVKQAVLNVGGNILGVVLNNVDVRHDQHYQYYTSYYNYYYQKPQQQKADKKPAKKAPVSAVQQLNGEKDQEDTY